MSIVNIDDLPKKQKQINWRDSIGSRVQFECCNVKGELLIKGYNSQTKLLTVEYNGEIKEINRENLVRGRLDGFLGFYQLGYKYSVGEIVGNKKIIEQVRLYTTQEKGYIYQCLECGAILDVVEKNIIKTKCPVHVGGRPYNGINTIADVRKDLIIYLVDEEDAKRYTPNSNTPMRVKCPECGLEKTMSANTLTRQGISCNKCSDGISYPEKFVYNIFEQLELEFEYQKKFTWSNNKRYDFYIPQLDLIIETHGIQHYEETKIGKYSLEEIQENDSLKKNLAQNKVTNYIVLNCRLSEMYYIKNSIINSDLPTLLNFKAENINWMKANENGMKTRVKEICDLWSSGLTNILLIQDRTKLTRKTIRKYLKNGAELGWCDYNVENEIFKRKQRAAKGKEKKVELFLDGRSIGIFSSITYVEKISKEYLGVKLQGSKLNQVANGVSKKHKGLTCKYICKVAPLTKLEELVNFKIEHEDWINKYGENKYQFRIQQCSQLWEEGKNIDQISSLSSYTKETVIKYLKKGKEMGICSYNL